MMGKLNEMKQKVEETKARLDTITVEGEAYEGAVQVIVSGNREVRDIIIADKLLTDKEELQDMLILATNRALEKAEKLNEAEMQGAAQGFLPPGFGM